MAITVRRPNLTWKERIYLPAILGGMVITIRHLNSPSSSPSASSLYEDVADPPTSPPMPKQRQKKIKRER